MSGQVEKELLTPAKSQHLSGCSTRITLTYWPPLQLSNKGLMVLEEGHGARTLRDYLRVLRRRKWIVLLVLIVVPLAFILVSLRQQPLYEGTAKVLLSRESLVSSLTGAADRNAGQPPERVAQTQAELARHPTVAQRVLEAVGLANRTPADLLAHSSVTGQPDADVLTFRVTDSNPRTAERLAEEYARQFAEYRRETDTRTIVRARKEIEARIEELGRPTKRNFQVYADLIDQREQLRTMEILRTSSTVLASSTEAQQVAPHTVRNGILGLVLGLVLGVGLAFVREGLDTRVRSADEIGHRLGLPLLARLTKPPRRLRRKKRLVMLERPNSAEAEAFRVLRTNFSFANYDKGARVVMVTSAQDGEGKSTTVANLAVALARAGQRVALIDLGLRRPLLDRFFGLEDHPGFTDVAVGRASLGEAVGRIALNSGSRASTYREDRQVTSGPPPPNPSASRSPPAGSGLPEEPAVALEQLVAIRELGMRDRRSDPEESSIHSRAEQGNGAPSVFEEGDGAPVAGRGDGWRENPAEGVLEVVSAGPAPPNPGEFIGTPVVAEVLAELRERADIVLVDASSLLHVGDAIALSAQVDALFVVTRIKVRRPVLTELKRVLDACPASKLGFVASGAQLEEPYGYEGSYQTAAWHREGDLYT